MVLILGNMMRNSFKTHSMYRILLIQLQGLIKIQGMEIISIKISIIKAIWRVGE